MSISFLDVRKYNKSLPHQVEAIKYLGTLLLRTPAGSKLGLVTPEDWIKVTSDEDLQWLQKQISQPTLEKFTSLWRAENFRYDENKFKDIEPKEFSQRDNPIKPLTSCNSSAHAMFTDFNLRNNGKAGLNNDDDYVRRVYSGKYGTYAQNNSMSWDVQVNVCRSFGVKAQYTNEGKAALIAELKKGNVCPLNIWHRGTNKASRSGGHVVLGADYDEAKGFLIYDPFGSRPPQYSDTKNGIYWMREVEFNFRFQGIFTRFLGLV